MTVPSLEDIAFFSSIKWKQSELLPLIVQRVCTMKMCKYLYFDEDINKEIQKMVDPITKKMMQYTQLPLRFRARWVVAFQGILTKFFIWGLDLAKNLNMNGVVIDKTHIRYCIERIIQDQVGQIDKPKTILKILEDSMFVMRFQWSSFIERHLMDDKELKIIAKHVLEEVSKMEEVKLPKLLLNEDVRMVRRNIDNLIAWYSSERDQSQAEMLSSNGTLRILVAEDTLRKVNFYVKHQRRLSPDSLQEQLLQTADHLLSRDLLGLRDDMLMFLHDNMEPGTWTRVLKKHFVQMFLFMMKHSWRHRRLCVRWFTSVQHTLDPVSFCGMFLQLVLKLADWKHWKYDYYEIMEILQSIWFNSPDRLKTDDEFIFRIVPELFVLKYDVNVLEFFSKCYGPEQQRVLLCQIVLHLLEKNKEDLIPKCLEIVPQLELNKSNYKTMFNAGFLKKHLVQHNYLHSDHVHRDYNGYLDLLSSNLGDFQNINKLKQELLNDKQFVIQYLSTHWNKDKIYKFLLWCHNGNTELLDAYKSRLLSESVIENVYESIFMKLGNIFIAGNVLIYLKLTKSEDIVIKKNVLNKSKIKRRVLHRALKKRFSFINFKNHLAFYFVEEHEQETMEKLFLCDAGRDAILQLLLPTEFENNLVVEDMEVGHPVFDLSCNILQIKNSLLKPYSLEDKVENMLSEYGHPNSRELQIEYHRAQSEREMAVARKLLDFNYRCARAILHRDFTEDQLYTAALHTDTATYTDFSLNLAAQAGLDIPSVL